MNIQHTYANAYICTCINIHVVLSSTQYQWSRESNVSRTYSFTVVTFPCFPSTRCFEYHSCRKNIANCTFLFANIFFSYIIYSNISCTWRIEKFSFENYTHSFSFSLILFVRYSLWWIRTISGACGNVFTVYIRVLRLPIVRGTVISNFMTWWNWYLIDRSLTFFHYKRSIKKLIRKNRLEIIRNFVYLFVSFLNYIKLHVWSIFWK